MNHPVVLAIHPRCTPAAYAAIAATLTRRAQERERHKQAGVENCTNIPQSMRAQVRDMGKMLHVGESK